MRFEQSRYPLHAAAKAGDLSTVKRLIESHTFAVDTEDNKGRTALHYAVTLQKADVSEFLIRNGSLVDAMDFAEVSPAHIAAEYGVLAQISLLWQRGAEWTIMDKFGKTPFDVACEHGHLQVSSWGGAGGMDTQCDYPVIAANF
ncbi:Protein C46H3.3 [Aphelenchoides avenae]|nr:Protein C46H3.3 [Aphelenchus avenae]